MKRLRITHAKDGAVTVEAEGFVGAACLAFSAPFLERLGVPIDAAEPTAAMDQVDEEATSR